MSYQCLLLLVPLFVRRNSDQENVEARASQRAEWVALRLGNVPPPCVDAEKRKRARVCCGKTLRRGKTRKCTKGVIVQENIEGRNGYRIVHEALEELLCHDID